MSEIRIAYKTKSDKSEKDYKLSIEGKYKSPVTKLLTKEKKNYNESKLVGKKGNHPLRLSIINLAIVKSTVKESWKRLVEN